MEVKKGYKQTDLGIIPEEWDVKKIGGVTRSTAGGTPSTSIPEYWGGEIRWMSSGELHSKFVYEVEGRITEEGLKNSSTKIIPEKCVLIGLAGQGKTRGTVAINMIELCTNQSIAAIFPSSQFVPEYLFYNLDARYTELRSLSTGDGGRGGLNLRIINSLLVPFPLLPEQKAIACTLRDMDALLNALDALIAKKRLIKQGAMQELLTGKKRLAGFNDEWKIKSLGEMFDFSGGFTASRDQLSSDGYCYLHYGDIHLSNKTFIDVKAEFEAIPKLKVPLKKISEASLLRDGDVVFVDASEDNEGASKHVVVVNPEGIPFISGLHTIVAKSKTEELAHLYRRYCFQTRALKNQFLFYAVGTKVTGISKSNIAKINIPVPSVPEQTAIAEILSDMDAEIAALEQKREKTRLLKQGMMQELLTGRIRLT